jgi:hypothetical protein
VKLLYRTVLAISIAAAAIAVVIMAMVQPPASSSEAEEDVWIVTSMNGQPIHVMRFNGRLLGCRSYLDHADPEEFRRDNLTEPEHPPTVECVQSAISPMILTRVGKD